MFVRLGVFDERGEVGLWLRVLVGGEGDGEGEGILCLI